MRAIGAAVCAISAMIGAGFASGREIMTFYTRYGHASWLLCAATGLETALLAKRILTRERRARCEALSKTLLLLLWIVTAGSMTAASGALWALTAPIPNARFWGGGLTLLMCLSVCDRPMGVLRWLGRGLTAVLLLALVLCFSVKPEETQFSPDPGIMAGLARALGYGAMNAGLCAGVFGKMREDFSERDRRRIALLVGGGMGLLSAVENALLLRHAAALEHAALPTVLLLRSFGKAGYILSALLLYLAAMTTLIAALSGIRQTLGEKRKAYMLPVATLITGCSFMGFSEIVSAWYPLLGWLCLLLQI